MKKETHSVLAYLLVLVLGLGSVFVLIAGSLQLLSLITLNTILAPLYALDDTDNSEAILYSRSPEGTYLLICERINPGVTEIYDLRVRLAGEDADGVIYYAGGEQNAQVEWLSSSLVRINGVTLDLSRSETYRRMGE